MPKNPFSKAAGKGFKRPSTSAPKSGTPKLGKVGAPKTVSGASKKVDASGGLRSAPLTTRVTTKAPKPVPGGTMPASRVKAKKADTNRAGRKA